MWKLIRWLWKLKNRHAYILQLSSFCPFSSTRCLSFKVSEKIISKLNWEASNTSITAMSWFSVELSLGLKSIEVNSAQKYRKPLKNAELSSVIPNKERRACGHKNPQKWKVRTVDNWLQWKLRLNLFLPPVKWENRSKNYFVPRKAYVKAWSENWSISTPAYVGYKADTKKRKGRLLL